MSYLSKRQKKENFGRGDWKAYFKLIPYIKLPWVLIAIGFIVNMGQAEIMARVPVSTSALFSGVFTSSALISAVVYNFLNYGLMFGSICLISCISAEAIKRARSAMWDRMLRLKMDFYDTNDPANLMSTITNDTETAVGSLITQLISIIPSLYYLGRVFYTLKNYDFRLLTSMLILIPANLIFVIVIGRWLYEVNAGIFTQVGNLTGYLAERVSNVFLIRSFTNEKAETEQGLLTAKGLYHAKIRGAKVNLISGLGSSVLDILQRAVPIIFGVYLLRGKYITMAQWVAFFLFVGQIIAQVNNLIGTWGGIKSAQGAAARMIKIFEAVEEEPVLNGEECVEYRGDLVFHNVNFAYGNQMVLKNVNLTIPYGKATALVGQCGSGKSTIMNIIQRLYTVTSGEVSLNQKNIQDYQLESYRDQFSYVQQDAGIFGGTYKSAMTYGLKRNLLTNELEEAAAKTGANQMAYGIEEGYDAPLAIGGTSVSGGQRQRIALTREVLKDRACMLLDEPTSALDAKSACEIQKKILELFNDRTRVLITHDLRLLMSVDQVVYLEDGEVKDSGNHYDLMKRCKEYRELVECSIGKEAVS